MIIQITNRRQILILDQQFSNKHSQYVNDSCNPYSWTSSHIKHFVSLGILQGALEHVFYHKVIVLLLRQLLASLTHEYATPRAGHCTHRRWLKQPKPRQPNQPKVNTAGFLKWKHDFLTTAESLTKGMCPRFLQLPRTAHTPNALE